MGIGFKKSMFVKKNVFFFFLCFALTKNFAQVPKSFLSHRVKKDETLDQIIKKYEIKESQLLEYKTFLKKNITLNVSS